MLGRQVPFWQPPIVAGSSRCLGTCRIERSAEGALSEPDVFDPHVAILALSLSESRVHVGAVGGLRPLELLRAIDRSPAMETLVVERATTSMLGRAVERGLAERPLVYRF